MNSRRWTSAIIIVAAVIAIPSFMYEECRIDVPNKHLAVLTKKVGKDLKMGEVLRRIRNTRACKATC